MKKHISLILTIGVVALFVWYGVAHPEMFKSLGQVSLLALFLIVALRLVTIWSNGLFTKWTVEAFTDRLSMGEGFMVAVLTAVGNFFGPLLGGMGIRAVYLKKYHRLPYSKFTSTLIGYYQMMFIFNSLLAVGSLLFLPRTHQTWLLILFFVAWIVGFAAFAVVHLPKRERMGRLERTKVGSFAVKVLYDVEDGWKLLRGNKVLMVRMAALAIINLIALYLISLVEFKALNLPMNAATLGLYTALVQASLLLSITPGAVGLREAMLFILAATVGLTNQEIIQIAILDRGIYFVMLAVLLVVTRQSKLRRAFTKIRDEEQVAQN
jgi:uncharacterized membrane protein YbhN (UPF0104 family)